MTRTALIAGEGALPRAVLARLGRADVWALEGHPPDLPGVRPRRFRLETLGSVLEALVADGVARVVFAGRIARPAIDPARIDAATRPLMDRLGAALGSGDDAALRQVIALFEAAGLQIVAPQEIAPELLPRPGVTGPTPSAADTRDADRAQAVLDALGPLDVGQGCVVASGQVLAIEALPGTDWMLRSLVRPRAPAASITPAEPAGDPLGWAIGEAADWLTGPAAAPTPGPELAPTPGTRDEVRRPPGGVLLKAPKPGQDPRIDLPTIGPRTIEGAAAADLRGVVIAAGGVLCAEPEATRAACGRTGLFLWVRQ